MMWLKLELIETLWNVNIDGMVLGYKDIGINRNIVECKLNFLRTREPSRGHELIETLWNVNVTISFLNLAKCPN